MPPSSSERRRPHNQPIIGARDDTRGSDARVPRGISSRARGPAWYRCARDAPPRSVPRARLLFLDSRLVRRFLERDASAARAAACESPLQSLGDGAFGRSTAPAARRRRDAGAGIAEAARRRRSCAAEPCRRRRRARDGVTQNLPSIDTPMKLRPTAGVTSVAVSDFGGVAKYQMRPPTMIGRPIRVMAPAAL